MLLCSFKGDGIHKWKEVSVGHGAHATLEQSLQPTLHKTWQWLCHGYFHFVYRECCQPPLHMQSPVICHNSTVIWACQLFTDLSLQVNSLVQTNTKCTDLSARLWGNTDFQRMQNSHEWVALKVINSLTEVSCVLQSRKVWSLRGGLVM